MTGIQTNTHIVAANSIDNGFQFFKFPTNLAALSCHGFQQDCHRIVMAQSLFQGIGNILDACFCALTHMAAGMEIVEISRKCGHAAQIIFQNFCGKGPCLGIGSAKIHGIGPVGHQFSEFMRFQHCHSFCGISRILFLCLAAPGIAGKEGKGIGPNGESRFHHSGIAAGC